MDRLEERLRSRTVADGYLRPDYDEYCFANVPGTVADVLGADLGPTLPDRVFEGVDTDVDVVVTLLVDAFGFEQFREQRGRHDFFDRLADRGRVTPLTGVYPTETAACVTTMHTGRRPVEHGILGWNAYVPELDEVIETLPFRTVGTGDPPGMDPEELFEGPTFYRQLADRGVESYAVQGATDGGYTRASMDGSDLRGYETTAEFALELRHTVEEAARGSGPAYVYAYYPSVDRACHVEGTRSELHEAELSALSSALTRELGRVDPDVAGDVLLTAVADHGQVDTVDGIDLLSYDPVAESIRRDRHGEPLVLGGPRNVHLCLDGDRREVRDCLEENLDALVLTREEALAEDLWGPGSPSETFERRCGDLLVLGRETSIWHGGRPGELDLVGMHGGLHPREAVVPFCAARLDRMQ